MSSGTFTISKEVLDTGVAILKIDGDLDGHSARTLQEEVTTALEQKRFKLVIDMSHVKYMSSAGAGVFILAEAATEKNGGDTVLLNPVKGVQHVFELLGLWPASKVFYKRADAVKYFER